MTSRTNLNYTNSSYEAVVPKDYEVILKFSPKNERKILKAFLLGYMQKLFYELFQNKIQCNHNNSSMGCYAMDSKIIQVLIQDIVDSGEYTLEGIAYSTHIPFDVIYDAACGNSNQLSITFWAKVIDLYIQVKPNISNILIDKLIELKNKNQSALSLLINEA